MQVIFVEIVCKAVVREGFVDIGISERVLALQMSVNVKLYLTLGEDVVGLRDGDKVPLVSLERESHPLLVNFVLGRLGLDGEELVVEESLQAKSCLCPEAEQVRKIRELFLCKYCVLE